MKHIKPINTYKVISYDEYSGIETIPISDRVISEVKKTLSSLDISLGISIHVSGNNMMMVIDDDITLPRVNIYQLEDEYFFINKYYHFSVKRRRREYDRFYKCDQIDGLIDCLKEIYRL